MVTYRVCRSEGSRYQVIRSGGSNAGNTQLSLADKQEVYSYFSVIISPERLESALNMLERTGEAILIEKAA